MSKRSFPNTFLYMSLYSYHYMRQNKNLHKLKNRSKNMCCYNLKVELLFHILVIIHLLQQVPK